jgi:PIN domain nuclease of toxin-antitoxin system
MPLTVNIHEAKTHFSKLLARVSSGEEVIIAIKARLGRLQLPNNPGRFIIEQLPLHAMTSLPIQLSHALHVFALPTHHRDPVDRILVAQRQLENLPFLTADPQIARYPVEVMW